MKSLTRVRPRRDSPILVCRKCLKRCTGGSGIKRALKSELKHRVTPGAKAARVVTTSCFGICPKKAVVVASGASLRDGEYLLVSEREAVADALDALQLQNKKG